MKAKTKIDEISALDDLHLRGVLDHVPHATEPRSTSDGYDILTMIDGYENEGRKILKDGGYPLTVREIIYSRFDKDGVSLGEKPLSRRIKDVMNMLTYFNMVRIKIKEKDISFALCFMAYGVQAAMKARIRPVEPLIEMGKLNIDGGRTGGKKSGEIRFEKTKQLKNQWQKDAEKIWKKHPTWKNKPVAEYIAKNGGNPNTIRKFIKKPTP